MSAQEPETQPIQPPVPVTERRGVSRRSILRGAAGVGGVGVVAAAVGAGAAVAVTKVNQTDMSAPNKDKPKKMAAMPVNAMEGPLVVYLSDTTTGELDVFGAAGQTRIHDPALVSRLLQSMK